MKDWIVRNLPCDAEISHYRGVQAGDLVGIHGWRHRGSVDIRRVVRLTRWQSGSSVCVWLDQPLHGGSDRIDFHWLEAAR